MKGKSFRFFDCRDILVCNGQQIWLTQSFCKNKLEKNQILPNLTLAISNFKILFQKGNAFFFF